MSAATMHHAQRGQAFTAHVATLPAAPASDREFSADDVSTWSRRQVAAYLASRETFTVSDTDTLTPITYRQPSHQVDTGDVLATPDGGRVLVEHVERSAHLVTIQGRHLGTWVRHESHHVPGTWCDCLTR